MVASVDLNNTFALRAGAFANAKVGANAGEKSSSEDAWMKSAQAVGMQPQTVSPLRPSQGVSGVEKTTEVLEGNSEAAIASIGQRGMRAYDTEVGVNQPMAVGTYHNGKQTGVVGGEFRMAC